MLNHIARTRLLQAVGLGEGMGLTQVDYAYWCDPLKHVDGYEIMAYITIKSPQPLENTGFRRLMKGSARK